MLKAPCLYNVNNNANYFEWLPCFLNTFSDLVLQILEHSFNSIIHSMINLIVFDKLLFTFESENLVKKSK